MINFLPDGTTVIDFPAGPVTLKSPVWGSYKRIRAERERIADEANTRLQALPDLPTMPDATDDSEEAQAKRVEMTAIYRQRVAEVEEITAETLFRTWRFIICGDGSFAGLGTPKPSDDMDEWPLDLIVDAGEFEVVNGVRTRTNTPIIDQFFSHLGRARSSGRQVQ